MFAYRLTEKAIFFDKQTLWLLLAFFGLRLLSIILVGHPGIQGIILFGVIMGFGILYYKNPTWAWYVLIGEILLGGAGHFLELFGLSLRSLLTLLFMLLWGLHTIGAKGLRHRFHIQNPVYYAGIPFFILLLISVILGMSNGHNPILVLQDFIPYFYLILLLPAYYLFKDHHSHEYFVRLIIVFIIGSALFSLITFILFSLNITPLHGEYYSWFRDVAMGKITDMNTGFFRIVLPEHLLFVPISIIIGSLLMRNEKHHKMWRFLLFCSMFILALNLSRGYFLALGVGFLVLKYKHVVKEWIKESLFALLLLIVSFSGVHLIASNFQSPGFELFGFRLLSIAQPAIEQSANIRMTLLDPIMRKIEVHPLFGHGLGATVTYTNPRTNELLTTSQFDWGYLEMWTELGFLGSAAYLTVVLFVIFQLIKKIRAIEDFHDMYVGILASIIAFLIMNITAPALFHVFGIVFLVFSTTYAMKPVDIFERTATILYRTFHKLHLPKLK